MPKITFFVTNVGGRTKNIRTTESWISWLKYNVSQPKLLNYNKEKIFYYQVQNTDIYLNVISRDEGKMTNIQ